MRCFEKLVKSHFLANISQELSLARQALELDSQTSFLRTFDKKERKHTFDSLVYNLYVREEIQESLIDWGHKDTIFFLTIPNFVFAYSKNKEQIDEALRYHYNQNGEMALYTGYIVVDKVRIYISLIDQRLVFTPISPN